MRITWILRFRNNGRNHERELTGPLPTEEIQAAVNIWIVKLQKKMLDYPQYWHYEEQLNLVKDEQGIAVCNGKIQGFNSIFLSWDLNYYRDGYGRSPKNSTCESWIYNDRSAKKILDT